MSWKQKKRQRIFLYSKINHMWTNEMQYNNYSKLKGTLLLISLTRYIHFRDLRLKYKGYRGGPGQKIYISFILIYIIALSFFFPKWGHTLLNYRYFWFYVHLREGGIFKYRLRMDNFYANSMFIKILDDITYSKNQYFSCKSLK